MAINDSEEARLAAARSRKRQNQDVPYLIRDDGDLYPNVPLVAKDVRFRPFHGDVNASLNERLDYLRGIAKKRKVTYNPQDTEPFEIGTADLDDLLMFAMDEYGVALDSSLPLRKLREQVYRLSQGMEAADEKSPTGLRGVDVSEAEQQEPEQQPEAEAEPEHTHKRRRRPQAEV